MLIECAREASHISIAGVVGDECLPPSVWKIMEELEYKLQLRGGGGA